MSPATVSINSDIMMRSPKKNKNGFTIIEVIVASFIGMIILAAALVLLSVGQRCFVTGIGFADIHSEARKTMDRIARDIRWATRVMAGSDNDTLILEIPSIDAQGDIIDIDATYDYVTYRLNPADLTELERVVQADAASSRANETLTIANDVSAIEYSSGGVVLSAIAGVTALTDVSIDVTTTRNMVGGWTLDEAHVSSAHLRNR